MRRGSPLRSAPLFRELVIHLNKVFRPNFRDVRDSRVVPDPASMTRFRIWKRGYGESRRSYVAMTEARLAASLLSTYKHQRPFVADWGMWLWRQRPRMATPGSVVTKRLKPIGTRSRNRGVTKR